MEKQRINRLLELLPQVVSGAEARYEEYGTDADSLSEFEELVKLAAEALLVLVVDDGAAEAHNQSQNRSNR